VAKKDLNTVKNLLFWSYANLAMAHTAVDKKQEKYAPFNYMIRAKLFKGLMDDSMNVRTIFDDEKIKLSSGNKCSYCGGLSKTTQFNIGCVKHITMPLHSRSGLRRRFNNGFCLTYKFVFSTFFGFSAGG